MVSTSVTHASCASYHDNHDQVLPVFPSQGDPMPLTGCSTPRTNHLPLHSKTHCLRSDFLAMFVLTKVSNKTPPVEEATLWGTSQGSMHRQAASDSERGGGNSSTSDDKGRLSGVCWTLNTDIVFSVWCYCILKMHWTYHGQIHHLSGPS